MNYCKASQVKKEEDENNLDENRSTGLVFTLFFFLHLKFNETRKVKI